MVYQIKISPLAQDEIELALDFCFLSHRDGPAHFLEDMEHAYGQLSTNPWKPIRYKTVRSIRLEKCPFVLYFLIVEKEKLVQILSCFQDFRNPRRKSVRQV
jgi:toxin ParE1/3/4